MILNNYAIHPTANTARFIEALPRLHVLPPYSPDHNGIERRVRRKLHATVTMNHRHTTIDDLRGAADAYLNARSRRAVAES